MARRGPPPLPETPEQIVTTSKELDSCLTYLETVPILGFDTEFVGEETYRPDLGLIQLSTPERLIIIDPIGLNDLTRFWELLTDPKRTTVVHSGREDIRMCWYATGRPPANVVDVQQAAGLIGLTYPISYAGLVQEVLRIKTQKGETLTDWRRRPLSANQLRYAFDDVRYLLPIWQRLRERLTRLKRLSWAQEEFANLVQRSIADEAQTERWRKLKGIGALSRKELAVVRELYYWRDRRAAQWNRPQRIVLRDELLAEIAKRPPSKLEEIYHLRGVPRSEAEAIYAAVNKASALSPTEWPDIPERDLDAPQLSTLAGLLQIVLTDWANQYSMAPNLVCSLADLKSLIRAIQNGSPVTENLVLARGWRSQAVLPYLKDFLGGQFALRVTDLRSTKPIRLESISPPIADEPSEL